MMTSADSVDFIEEIRLRRWARENYCYAEARQPSWHPIVHDEMRRQDSEGLSDEDVMIIAACDEPESPSDSTILTDIPDVDERIDITPAAQATPSSLGPIVPLAPDLPGLHGPHEITPPHGRVTAPSETSEMHYT